MEALNILRELRQGVRVEVKPGDGAGSEDGAADGEDTTAAAEVGNESVLDVPEGGRDGMEHAGCYVRSGRVLL